MDLFISYLYLSSSIYDYIEMLNGVAELVDMFTFLQLYVFEILSKKPEVFIR